MPRKQNQGRVPTDPPVPSRNWYKVRFYIDGEGDERPTRAGVGKITERYDVLITVGVWASNASEAIRNAQRVMPYVENLDPLDVRFDGEEIADA